MAGFLKFPDAFLWGSAVSGHQIEGGNKHSDWWHWELSTVGQPISDQANDYWNRFEEDHQLLADMGHQAYRLGIEWARVEPKKGQFNLEAVEQYRRILESLRQDGTKICLTLHHWVLPQWVAKEDGWRNPDTVKNFLRYVEFVIREFGEYPVLWVTLNEPMVASLAGNISADFPPQRRSLSAFRKVTRNMLRAHAGAYRLIHAHDPAARVGIAMAYPCLEAWGSCGFAGWYERLVVHIGKIFVYKAWDQSVETGKLHLLLGQGEIEGLRRSVDFCGVNYYFRMSPRFSLKAWRTGFVDTNAIPAGIDTTDIGWQIYPEGIHNMVKETWDRFGKPIFITENGIADATDCKREGYLVEHLKQLHRAVREGIPVEGYFHWSFIDNFEWKEGFDQKFGLVAVDYADPQLKRTPRPSAARYTRIIRENGLEE